MLPWTRYKIEQKIENTCGWVLAALCIAIPFVIFLRLVEPFWPVTTLIFFIIVTKVGSIDNQGKVMAFGGLVAYGLSWPTTDQYGTLFGLAVCLIGLLTWFWSFARGIELRRVSCRAARH